MSVAQESLTSLEEQLALDDHQLALKGIGRSIAAAEAEITAAEQSIKFSRGYRPSHPGDAPGPEAGGMDHQDYRVALHEYRHADDEMEEAIESARGWARSAEDALFDLDDDKSLVEAGDQEAITKYAAAERKRLAEELAKQRATAESDARREKHKAGAEIAGAEKLAHTVESLIGGISDKTVANRKGPDGWAYRQNGTFDRNMGQGPFDVFTERLQLREINGNYDLTYLKLPEDSEVKEAGREGRITEEPAEYYSFRVSTEGIVSEQDHAFGPITQGPDSIGNGVNNYYPKSTRGIETHRMDRTHNKGKSPDAVVDAEDICGFSIKFVPSSNYTLNYYELS